MPAHHGETSLHGLHALCGPHATRSDRFGRLLPDAPALYVDPRHLAALGAKNGPMQGSGPAPRTTSVAVGLVFFGQFVDHDVTLDLTSSFARLDGPEITPNFRTPQLDLDCVYGDGPEGSPYLYWSGRTGADAAFNGVKLLTGADAPGATPLQREDLPRSYDGRAIIGDPRNDENRLISQLQLGFLRFHNRVADALHAAHGLEGAALFEEARRVVRWHYQWVVLHDFLPAMCGHAVVDDVLGRGRRVYRPEDRPFGADGGADPFIPVEFSVAAYRFGHSMVPQVVQVQPGKPALGLFGPKLGRGFAPLADADAVVDWRQVLDLTDPTVDRAETLDARLAPILLDLPFVTSGEASLATRNLLRGQAFRLPSGEVVADRAGRPDAEVAAVTAAAKALAAKASVDLAAGTPLWLYLLLEAGTIGRETTPGHFEPGEGLGPVGARLVAETFIGLLELDPHAFLGADRSWSPDGPDKVGANGVHTLLELLVP